MKTTRSYTMDSRARAVEETRTRIADAMFDLVSTRRLADISLDDVAARAGVSVQTVLRHYGSRSGLIEGAREYATARVDRERSAPVGDVDRALRVLLDHYELRGRMALLLLAQEDDDPLIADITANGRAMHRSWVATVFAPHLNDGGRGEDALLDLLVVATDVYTWKLLRLDRRLSRSRTQTRMATLVRAVLGTVANDTEEN